MKTLVIAPHPDDELLGCGGTLLRYKSEGARIGWMIATSINEKDGWPVERVRERSREIVDVCTGVGIASEDLFQLGFPTASLDSVPMSELVGRVSEVFKTFEPEQILVPHGGDVHSDHRIIFDVVSACCKWFRYPSIRQVLSYETLSETEFGMDPKDPFIPNVFVNITDFLEQKSQLFELYRSEVGAFPFPRSREAIQALATVRGSRSGFKAAEAFRMLLLRIE